MKREIIKDECKSLGVVYFAFPANAWIKADVRDICTTTEEGPYRSELLAAAVIANCYVDEKGKQIYQNYRSLLSDVDPSIYDELSEACNKHYWQFVPGVEGDPAKNSESGQNSSSPSTSPES